MKQAGKVSSSIEFTTGIVSSKRDEPKLGGVSGSRRGDGGRARGGNGGRIEIGRMRGDSIV